MSLAYVAVGALVCVWLARRIFDRKRSDVWRLPGPPSHCASWIWGHEKLAFNNDTFLTYAKWARDFGPVFQMKAALFHPSIVVVTDHAAAHHLFQQYDDFVKATQIRALVSKGSGDNLLVHEHDEWRRERRLLAPAFSVTAVKDAMTDIMDCVTRLERTLMNNVVAGGGEAVVNISELVSTCALDIIGRTSFGFDFQEGQSAEAQAIMTAWNVRVTAERPFFFQIITYIYRAFPFLAELPIPMMKEAMVLKEVTSKIAAGMLERGQFSEKGRDALSILVRASGGTEGEDTLSRQALIDNMTLLILAGAETTAGTLTFTLLDLARNPEAQNRLRQEVKAAENNLTYDGIQKLEYLDAVVKEGLRLHPTATSTERIAEKDCVIPLSTPVHTADGELLSSFQVKAGQLFYIPYKAINANPKVWGPDADEFVPDRWITPGGVPAPSELPYGWGGLVSFADGPRMCIGYRLALLEMKTVLATLIRTFEFHDTGARISEQGKPTLQAVTDDKLGVLPLRVSFAP